MAVEIVMPEQVPQKPVPKPLAQPEPVVPPPPPPPADATVPPPPPMAMPELAPEPVPPPPKVKPKPKPKPKPKVAKMAKPKKPAKVARVAPKPKRKPPPPDEFRKLLKDLTKRKKPAPKVAKKTPKIVKLAAEAEAHSICLRAPSGRERIVQESTATDCSLLEYPRRRQECAENENRGSHPSQPRWVFTWQSAGYRYKAVSQRSIVPGRGRKCCSRTFEPTLQPFAVTLWPV